jgi:hypothetical protein
MEPIKKVVVALVIIALLLFIGLGFVVRAYLGKVRELEVVSEVLKAKEDGVQDLNNRLGIAQSDLLSKSEMADKYKKELDSLSVEFQGLMRKHDLKIDSRDRVVVKYKNIEGPGKTVIVQVPSESDSSPVCDLAGIKYEWTSKDNTFHFIDPDLKLQGDESLEYELFMAVNGYIYSDADGTVKVRKLEITELRPDSDGKLIPKTSKVSIVSNNFEYVKQQEREKHITDIFHPRLFASFGNQLRPGLGVELLNLGRVFDYVNVGLNTKVDFALGSGVSGLAGSTLGVGVTYNLLPPLLNTNLGVSVGVATPANTFLRNYVLTLDAVFYLTN